MNDSLQNLLLGSLNGMPLPQDDQIRAAGVHVAAR